MKRACLLLTILSTVACSDPAGEHGSNAANASNGTDAGNNAMPTDGGPDGTTGSNNATTGPNQGTGAQTNGQTGRCEPLDPALGPCDPICQTGCGIGEHCVAVGDPLEALCEDAGLGEQSDTCNADTECAIGLHCRAVGGGPQLCMAYCDPDAPDCGDGYGCVRLAADQRLGACVAIDNRCDAVPEDTCPDPDECYDTITGRQCLPSGDGAEDEGCARSSDCGPGLRCVGVGDQGQLCRPLCDPDGDGAECADGNCNQLQDPGGEPLSWGACL